MFCSGCGKEVRPSDNFCCHCGRPLTAGQSAGPSSISQKSVGTPHVLPNTFMEYRKKKSEERQKFKAGEKRKAPQKVQICIGLMAIQKGLLKPVRGRTVHLTTDPDTTADDLHHQGELKMRAHNRDMSQGDYILLYPDGSEIKLIPGTERPFVLSDYKNEIGKTYQRLNFYLCLKDEYETAGHMTDSDVSDVSDVSEEESPLEVTCEVVKAPDQPSSRTYTELYAPILIEDDDDDDDVDAFAMPSPTERPEDSGISATEVIAELAAAIDRTKINRFNITRSNVWDGAMRGLKRSTFQENADFYVKFSDDAGLFEESIDSGGPKREFLSLIINLLPSRPIFDGPPHHRYLVYNTQAIKDDEYFLAGKLIALSVIHGGPGPNFLSKALVAYIVGQQISASIHDVTDGEIVGALSEIESAGTLQRLQDLLVVHSSMLHMAGCFRRVEDMEERHVIVSEYLRWYIIQRNCSVIDRFKEGLASLHFLEALCQHPTVMTPVLQHTTKRLSPSIIEQLFTPQLSRNGSNRRSEENLVLSFWADYLLDCEEKGPVSLTEILMFGTGLTAIPPGEMFPRPSLSFTESSKFPLANTCGNTLTIPLHTSYDRFKENMDFGVQNSPGFGCP